MTEVEKLREDLEIMLNGFEAAITQFRKSQGMKVEPQQAHENLPFNIEVIKWTEIQAPDNPKGPYQKSDDVNSADFKALHKHIIEQKTATGKPAIFIKSGASTGTYWLFQNGATIGRRLAKKKT